MITKLNEMKEELDIYESLSQQELLQSRLNSLLVQYINELRYESENFINIDKFMKRIER